MDRTQVEFTPSGHVIACPNCRVCSISLSDSEYAQVATGQLMIAFCNVCSKEVVLNGDA